jgi:ligand-binding sensor domain-containing protein
MRYAVFISVACSLFFVNAVFGQADKKYIFRHITQSDGLVNNAIYSLLQDQRGFIWIGTQNGLQRYDGSRFVTYQNEFDSTDKSHISISFIDPLFSNQFLLSDYKKLDIATNTISRYTKADLLKMMDANAVFYTTGDTLWIVGHRYAYVCTGEKVYAYSMMKDSINGQIWVSTGLGLVLLDTKTKKVYTPAYNPLHIPLLTQTAGITVKALTLDSRHNIWINTWVHEFYRYEQTTQKLVRYSLNSLTSRHGEDVPLLVNQVMEDDHHVIWLTTSNAGLLQYDVQDDSFTAITAEPNNSLAIQYNFEIYCMIQDREGNIWLGTDKGLNIFNPYNQFFQVIRSDPNSINTLPKRDVNCVVQTKQGDILVGTWGGGITVYDSHWQFKRKINFPGKFDENLVWSFLERNDREIWVGCQHGYIHIYDPFTGKISTLHPDALQSSTIRCMRKDNEGNIVFGLHNGNIAVWNERQQVFLPCNDAVDMSKGIPLPVFNLLIDKYNSCWAATDRGLKQFDISRRTYTGVYNPGKNMIYACRYVEAGNDSTLLVGLVNGGLARFDTHSHTFYSIQQAGQLATATVNTIRKDTKDNTWFTTDYNLYRYNPSQNKYISYTIAPGVINSTFQSSGFSTLQDGRWVINTYTEILCFYPDSLGVTGNVPFPAEITGLKLFDKPVFIDSFLFRNKPIRFSNNENFLTLEFAALYFSNRRQVKYFYKLSGIDRDWVSTNIPSASYTNLGPGNYTFSVMTDNDGNKSEATVLHFSIAPMFWQTWWFILAVILLAGCVIYFIVKSRVAVIRRELALKRQMQEAEMMALRAQMNPHFIFNCINSIDALIQSNDKYQATIYLNKFAKLLRNILDSSKEKTVPLAKDLETLELYVQLEQFRHDNKFTYEIRTDPGLLTYDIRVPPLVIQPYVENAIQHGLRYRTDNMGKLLVNVHQHNGQLLYMVEDNGVGRELSASFRSDEKKSYGMDMSNDRIRLFNKDNKTSVNITDLHHDGQATGTQITIALKID